RAFGAGLEGADGKWGGAEGLRIGLTEVPAEAPATKDQHESVLFDGLYQNLYARQPNVPQPLDEPDAHLRRDTAGPTIGDAAGGVNRAEVSASRHVALAEIEFDSQRFEDSTAHRVAQGVIAEETEMPRAAPRCDARRHVTEQAARGLGGERVEVRQARRLHLRFPRLRVGQSRETVEGKEHDFRRVGHDERREEV